MVRNSSLRADIEISALLRRKVGSYGVATADVSEKPAAHLDWIPDCQSRRAAAPQVVTANAQQRFVVYSIIAQQGSNPNL